MIRANQTMNFEEAVIVRLSPVLVPTLKPENDGITTLAPGLVSRNTQLLSVAGAVNDHALVLPVMY